MCLDANNLYEWAPSQALPTGRFKWLSEKKNELDLPKYTEESKEGLILEVDFENQKQLHCTHNVF